MPPTPPFWVLQRQVKIEPVGEETLRLTAPNLPAYELGVKWSEVGWVGALSRPPTGEGPRVLLAESDRPLPSAELAWDAAFELYRQHVIV